MCSNNNCFCHPANPRRRHESGPEYLRQKTIIRNTATGSSVDAFDGAGGFFPEIRARMLQATTQTTSRLTALRPACHRRLTRHSSHSLRSLGRAKARPLTNRYALGEKMRWLILITSLALSANAMASEVCNTKQFDVCKKAREISDEMAKTLPMQLNKNLSIHKVSAIQNMISITALLAYDKATLDASLKQSNISQKNMEEIMMNSAKDSICISTPETNAFIGLGGAVQYIYKFIDGTTYSTINIESC